MVICPEVQHKFDFGLLVEELIYLTRFIKGMNEWVWIIINIKCNFVCVPSAYQSQLKHQYLGWLEEAKLKRNYVISELEWQNNVIKYSQELNDVWVSFRSICLEYA